jgi:hypothetical protein
VQKATGILEVHSWAKIFKELTFFLISAKGTVEFLKIDRSEARQVTGLLTGHCHLKGRLFKQYNQQGCLWEAPYGGRNSLTQPL